MTADHRFEGSRGLAVDVFLVGGRFAGTDTQALQDLVGYARAAEAAGFDAVWVAEHHFIGYGRCPSAPVMAGHLLGATTRLRVGTAAAILSNRHPVALAEEAAMLAAISGGRFLLGLARGGPWVDLEVFGTGLARYTDGFPDSLALVRRWLSGASTVDADGPHFRFRSVSVVPRPDRPIPIWIAATSEPTVAAAAAHGAALLLGMHATPNENRRLIERHAEIAERHGHDPTAAEHVTAHVAFVADTAAEARATVEGPLVRWLATTSEYVRIDGTTGPRRDPTTYARHLLDVHAVGSPDHCVQRLADAAATSGARRLMLMVEVAGEPTRTVENIERLGAQVVPCLRRSAPASR